MSDNRRTTELIDGGFRPILPNYTSTVNITQNDKLDVAVSKLDAALAAHTHNSHLGLQGGTAGEYFHLTSAKHDATDQISGSHIPSGTNKYAPQSYVLAQVSASQFKRLWGTTNGDLNTNPGDAVITFNPPTNNDGTINGSGVTFTNIPAISIGVGNFNTSSSNFGYSIGYGGTLTTTGVTISTNTNSCNLHLVHWSVCGV